jgi:hypothetical protein
MFPFNVCAFPARGGLRMREVEKAATALFETLLA